MNHTLESLTQLAREVMPPPNWEQRRLTARTREFVLWGWVPPRSFPRWAVEIEVWSASGETAPQQAWISAVSLLPFATAVESRVEVTRLDANRVREYITTIRDRNLTRMRFPPDGPFVWLREASDGSDVAREWTSVDGTHYRVDRMDAPAIEAGKTIGGHAHQVWGVWEDDSLLQDGDLGHPGALPACALSLRTAATVIVLRQSRLAREAQSGEARPGEARPGEAP